MTKKFDFIIIGSGIAGLTFALKAAEKGSVAIITKEKMIESNTRYAQGCIASVIDKEDSISFHYEDTLKAGAGLCHKNAVQIMAEKGPEMVKLLSEWGVNFDKTNSGSFELGREGGHSKHRIVHVHDFTGKAIQEALVERVKENSNIEIFEDYLGIDLITDHHRLKEKNKKSHTTCYGIYVLDKENKIHKFLSKVTLLGTGGMGKIYLHTTNPHIATGDGVAMAYRAGAAIGNLEFMQFHPTAFYHPSGIRFLVSETIRGFGAILRNTKGEAFMENYSPELKELSPRDIVARAIDSEMKKEGKPHVYLDLTHKNSDLTKEKFPLIYNTCLSYGIDITKDYIPVVPAAHYMCGGVVADLNGATNIKNLFASGEVAMSGVNGANRLASNSLLEGMVFSLTALNYVKENKILENTDFELSIPDWDDSGTFDEKEWVYISHDEKEIHQIMWDYVGIVRKESRLERACNRLKLVNEEIETFYKKTKITRPLIELRNISQLSLLITRSARFREESRGLHYIVDYPQKSAAWLHDTIKINERTIKRSLDDDGFSNIN
ncbi:MAG: L-aspartate oxidase [Calditrichia bacterium]|nr:L-aspartate oxidase [Calditrichia bacterium]